MAYNKAPEILDSSRVRDMHPDICVADEIRKLKEEYKGPKEVDNGDGPTRVLRVTAGSLHWQHSMLHA